MLASTEVRPALVLKILLYTGQPPTTRNMQHKMSTAPRLESLFELFLPITSFCLIFLRQPIRTLEHLDFLGT